MTYWNGTFLAILSVLLITVTSALVELPAIGRTARIGELYDAVTDTFRDITVFRKNWDSSIVTTLDTPLSEVSQMRVAKLRDKANLLRVSATITIGIYCGLIELSGTAEYLREEKQASSTQTQVFSLSVRTKRDILEDYGDTLKDFFSLQALNMEATHVVTAVDYGADVFIEFDAKNATESKREEIYGELALYFRKFEAIANAKASASVEFDQYDGTIASGLSIRIFGDLAIKNQYPLSLLEVVDFLRTVPSLINQGDGPKGNPISYTIAPIDQFRSKFNDSGTLRKLSRSASPVDETQSYHFLIIFEEIQDVEARIKEMTETFRINEDFVPYNYITSLEKLSYSFEEVVLSLKRNVSEALTDVRKGDDEAMTNIKEIYEANPFSAAKVAGRISVDYEAALEKIVEIQNFRQHGIQVLKSTGSVQEVLLKYPDQIIQVLYMTSDYKTDTNWASNVALLLRPLKNLMNQLVMVDCSFNNSFCPDTSVIKQYHNGRVLSEDVLLDYSSSSGTTVKMAGMGTEQKLGDLFDIRTGRFTATTVLDYYDPDAEFEKEDSSIEYWSFTAESFTDIMTKLSIPFWQGLNILHHNERGFNDKFSSKSGILVGYVLCVRRNSTRTLTLKGDTFVETDVVFRKEVTHFISEMTVASLEVFAFETKLNDQDRTVISETLMDDMEKFKEAHENFVEEEDAFSKLNMTLDYKKIQLCTNFAELPIEFETVQTFIEHLTLYQEPPLSLPCQITLQPVSILQEYLHFVIPTPKYQQISDEVARNVTEFYNQIHTATLELQDFSDSLKQFQQAVQYEDYTTFLHLSLHLWNEIENWKINISQVIEKVKYNEENEANIINQLEVFSNGELDHLNSSYFKSTFPVLYNKLVLARNAASLGVGYLGRGDWFQEIFIDQRINVSVALMKPGGISQVETWLQKDTGIQERFIVDCDFFPQECSADFEEREYRQGTLNYSSSLDCRLKEIQAMVSILSKETDVFYKNLTRHYDVLESFTDELISGKTETR